jgi:hypothetical protein
MADALGKPLDYFSQPIDVDLHHPGAGYSEVKELLQIMNELSDLPQEDRKSVVDYIRWLKSRKGE